jgi:hypothetical protein
VIASNPRLEGLEVLGEVVLLASTQSEAANAIIVLDDVGERPSAPIVEVRWMLP